jgi:hypothetical protein
MVHTRPTLGRRELVRGISHPNLCDKAADRFEISLLFNCEADRGAADEVAAGSGDSNSVGLLALREVATGAAAYYSARRSKRKYQHQQ